MSKKICMLNETLIVHILDLVNVVLDFELIVDIGGVVAGAAKDFVFPEVVVGVEEVVAVVTEQVIFLIPTADAVVSGATANNIFAVLATEVVVALVPFDRVVAVATV